MPAAKTGTKSQSKSSIGCLLWQKAGKMNGKRINKWGDQSSGKFLGGHHPLTTNFFSVCFLSLWLRLFQILSNNCSKFFHKKCSIKFSDLIEPLTLPLSAFYTMMVLGKLGPFSNSKPADLVLKLSTQLYELSLCMLLYSTLYVNIHRKHCQRANTNLKTCTHRW